MPSKSDDKPINGQDGDDSDEEVGPMPPSVTGKRKATEDEQEEEDEFGFESDDEQESDPLPVSHEIVLKDHNKVCLLLEVHTPGVWLETDGCRWSLPLL